MDGIFMCVRHSSRAPFEAGRQGQIAVKVIDDRGNEQLVVKILKAAQ
jgi:adenine-specific DNA-methyltransferase